MAKVKLLLSLLFLLCADYCFFMHDVQFQQVSKAVNKLAKRCPDFIQRTILAPFLPSDTEYTIFIRQFHEALHEAVSIVKNHWPKLIRRMRNHSAPWNLSDLVPDIVVRASEEVEVDIETEVSHVAMVEELDVFKNQTLLPKEIKSHIAMPWMLSKICRINLNASNLIRTTVVGITIALMLMLEGALFLLP